MPKLYIAIVTVVTILGGLWIYGSSRQELQVGTAPAVLKVSQGGTGAATFTPGDCLIGNGTGPITTGACGTGSGSSFSYPFPNNATSTSLTFTGTNTFATTTATNSSIQGFTIGTTTTVCIAPEQCQYPVQSGANASTQIQAAINSAASTTIYIKPGVYTFTTAFSFGTKSVHLVGSGTGKTIFRVSPSFSGFGTIYDYSNVRNYIEIEGITFDQNHMPVSAIQLGQSNHIYIHNNEMMNQYATLWTVAIGTIDDLNIDGTASRDIRFVHNYLHDNNNGTNETVLPINVRDSNFDYNYYRNNINTAFSFNYYGYCANSTVNNNIFSSTSPAIFILDSTDITANNNVIMASSTSQAGIAIANSHNITSNGNTISLFNQLGIGTYAFKIFDYGGNFDGHPSLYADVQNVVMDGNVITGGYQPVLIAASVNFNLAKYIYFSNNIVNGAVYSAIDVGKNDASIVLSHVYLTDNIILNSTVFSGLGPISVQGYPSDTSRVHDIYIRGNKVFPSTNPSVNLGIDTASGIYVSAVTDVGIDGNDVSGTGLGKPPIYLVNGATLKSNFGFAGGIVIGSDYMGTTSAPLNGALIQGFLGIATTSPGSALSVQGNMFIAGTIISTSTSASVFPYASTTALSVSSLTDGNCVQAGTDGILTTASAPCGTGTGSGWATTSADYWKTQNNFFSTTSATFFLGLQTLFSTTSADYWQTQRNFFSTTSASFFLAQNQTLAFSTSSAIFFANASTTIPKTYTSNTYTTAAIQTIPYASTTVTSATAFFATATSTFAGGIAGPGNFTVQQSTGFVSIGGSVSPVLQVDIANAYTSGSTGNAAGVLPYNSTPGLGLRSNATAAGTEATINLTNTTAASNAFSSGTGQIGVIRTNTPTAGNSAMVFRTFNNTDSGFTGLGEKMRLDYNGNLGLATTSPMARLTIAAPNWNNPIPLWMFVISSSTGGTATSTLFSVSNTGAIAASGAITSTANQKNVFPYASSTALTAENLFATNATTTALTVSNLISCDTIDTDASGNLKCGSDASGGGGGGTYPFTPALNWNALNQATSGILWLQNGLNASSSIRTDTQIYTPIISDDTETSAIEFDLTGMQFYANAIRFVNNQDNLFQFAGSNTFTQYLSTEVITGDRTISTPDWNGWLAVATGTLQAPRFVATSTQSSFLPYASSTAISAGIFCIGTDCRSAWPSGGGGEFPFTTVTTFGQTANSTSTALLALSGLYASTTSNGAPPFAVGSSTETIFLINNGGSVGVGTSTPSGKFAISNPSSSIYSMIISAYTGVTQFVITALGRVGIGTPNPQHDLDVAGRISGQPSYDCQTLFISQSNVTADQLGSATVASFACEGNEFVDVNTTGAGILANTAANTEAQMASGTPPLQLMDTTIATPIINNLVFLKGMAAGSATSTNGKGIAQSVVFRTPNVTTSTTSVTYIPVGFSDVALGSQTTLAAYATPANGCMMVASSTANWRLLCIKANAQTIADTGLATSTVPHEALLVLDGTGANLYIDGSTTASATIASANLPVVNLRPFRGVGLNSGSAVAQGRMGIGNVDVWTMDFRQ